MEKLLDEKNEKMFSPTYPIFYRNKHSHKPDAYENAIDVALENN